MVGVRIRRYHRARVAACLVGWLAGYIRHFVNPWMHVGAGDDFTGDAVKHLIGPLCEGKLRHLHFNGAVLRLPGMPILYSSLLASCFQPNLSVLPPLISHMLMWSRRQYAGR